MLDSVNGSINASSLLDEADKMYNSPASQLSETAQNAWRNGFVSGGEWMALALSELRKTKPVSAPSKLQVLGITKYILASTAALLVIGIAIWTKIYPAILLCIPAFYAVEVQMVFLFPIVLDGSHHPFRDSLRWTKKAGGTIPAMKIVMVLALVMIFGGFLGKGFIRCWCLGCLAVVLWYEKLLQETSVPTTLEINAEAI
ncbi:MAG: hypothetical protein AAF378_03860 [Cyanobacteria bacterium P01_A01_bin.84]